MQTEEPRVEKNNSRELLGKTVVTKSGKKFGNVYDLSFDIKTGELIHILLKNTTGFAEGLELDRDKNGNFLIPYSSVLAVGDFVVVAEEDIV
ncbi:hypothetical protein CL617_05080 [archaeon]|nr:hypothetical protein [archaeon]